MQGSIKHYLMLYICTIINTKNIMYNEQISFKLTAAQKKKIEAEAKRQQSSPAAVLRQLIEKL